MNQKSSQFEENNTKHRRRKEGNQDYIKGPNQGKVIVLGLKGKKRLITCKIPELQREELDCVALEEDCDRSVIIRDAIKELLEKELSQELSELRGEKYIVKFEETNL